MKKMKRLGVFLAVLAMLFAFAGCGEEEKTAEVSAPAPSPLTPLEKAKASHPAEMAMLELLPEDMQLVAKFGSIATLHERLAATESSVLGFEIESRDIEEMKKDLGFNLLALEEVKTAGFDTARPFCLAFSHMSVDTQGPDEALDTQGPDEAVDAQGPDEPMDAKESEEVDFDLLALLPVSDTSRVFDTVRRIFENNSMPYEEVQEGESLLVTWGDPDMGYGCLTVDGGFLHIAGNRFKDPRPFLLRVLQRSTSLAGSEKFLDVAVNTDLGRDVLMYADIASLKETVLSQVKKMAEETGQENASQAAAAMGSLKDFLSGIMTADFSGTDLNMDYVFSLASDSAVKKMRGAGDPDRQKFLNVTDPAVLLFSSSLDVAQYYKAITETYPREVIDELRANLDSIKQTQGIDVEKELIDNLGGAINLAMYDGSSVTMFNYNTVFEAGVKDEKKMKDLIDKAIALLPPERQGTVTRPKVGEADAYAMNMGFLQIYAAVKDGRLLVGTGKPIFEKALGGAEGQGFATRLSDDYLKKTLEGNDDIYYMNIDEMVKILQNFSPLLMSRAGGEKEYNDIVEVAGKFHYMLADTDLEGDLLTSRFKIKTRYDKPF